MNNRIVLTAFLATALSVSASAQGVIVEGLVDCGQWVEDRTRGQSAVLEGYVIGIFNGLALGSGLEFWKSQGVSVSREQVFLWMDKHCRDNPLSSVPHGSLNLMEERTGVAWPFN